MHVTARGRVLAPVLAILAGAAPALAQVDEGRDALANAEFRRAVRAFDAAERGPLDRAQYVALLEGRALASWASGDVDRARADLTTLAAFDPEHAFPREAPPDLTELFAELVWAREAPIAASALFTPGGDALTVTVQNDDLGLVSRVRAHVRSDGDWSIVEGEPPTATVPIAPDARRADAWVELIGPGGAVLATAGSEATPIVWERVRAGASAEPSGGAANAPGDDSVLFIGLGVGGALVVVAIVIAIAIAVSSGGTGGTQPGAPVVVGF